jgi:hypothetical protein
MLASHPLSEEDKIRNQIYFFFKKFKYDANLRKSDSGAVPLVSSIKKMAGIPRNCATL